MPAKYRQTTSQSTTPSEAIGRITSELEAARKRPPKKCRNYAKCSNVILDWDLAADICDECFKAEEQRLMLEEQHRQIIIAWKSCCPGRYIDKTLSKFDFTGNSELRPALNAALDNCDGLFLISPPGRGKTHILCAMGHELVKRGKRVFFIGYDLLVKRTAGSWGQGGTDPLDDCLSCDTLILDDLNPTPKTPDFASRAVTTLVNSINESLSAPRLLISANLELSEIDRRLDGTGRTASRLAALTRTVRLNGRDRRLDNRDSK